MTNAEKYLKDGVDINELASEMCKEYYEDTSLTIPLLLCTFFDKEIQPTLTEDERVILRNLDKRFYTKIFRNECLFLWGEHTSDLVFTEYDHLFQFIKERRRILY